MERPKASLTGQGRPARDEKPRMNANEHEFWILYDCFWVKISNRLVLKAACRQSILLFVLIRDHLDRRSFSEGCSWLNLQKFSIDSP